MKTLIGLGAGGAALAYWRSLPPIAKVPVVFGLGMLAASELNTDLNQSWFSSQIFAGQGADGAAKVANPVATLKAIDAGQPVTTAAATAAAQYSGLRAEATQKEAAADAAIANPVATLKAIDAGQPVTTAAATAAAQYSGLRAEAAQKEAAADAANADLVAARKAIEAGHSVKGAVATAAAQYQAQKAEAKQKEVYANAAEEGEDELLAKKAKGKKLSSTEQLRLYEIQSAEQELKIKKAEAAGRAVGLQILHSVDYGHGKHISGSEYARRAMEAEERKLDQDEGD